MLTILIDYGIRSTLLLGITGAAILLLRGRSSSWRHLVWLAGLLAVLALPAAKLIAPRWNAPVMTQRLLAAPARTVIYVTAQTRNRPAYDWVLLAWLGGAAFLLIRATRAQVLALGVARRASEGSNGERISGETEVPIVCGLLRPVIVLPLESEHWPHARLESVLRHERMHIARRDTVTQALAQFVCAIYWPQPLVWFAASALRNACEQACDDGVLSQGTKPSAYAEHLMEIARALQQPHAGPSFEGGIAMTRTNQLEERISALLNSKRDRRQAGASFAAAVSALAVTVVIGLAAIHTPLFAQTGKFSGVVHDPSGAVVAKARIDVQTTANARIPGVMTMHEVVYANAAGEFALDIPDGTYDITIAAPGFARQEHQGVLFQNATAKRMDLNLAIGAIHERMEIQSGTLEQKQAMDMKYAAERAAAGSRPAGSSLQESASGTLEQKRAAEAKYTTEFDANAVPSRASGPQRIRVGGNVQAANLLRKVTPLYPYTAKLDRVEGVVIMQAVISKEGNILSLEQVNKLVDPRLAEAAMEAVKQWQYKPTLLNGNPIEVVTQIDVNFTLSN